MITDELIGVLDVLEEIFNGKECCLLECIRELFMDFDSYVWNEMSEQERRNWIEGYISF